jgi:hypothetical protein
VTKSICAAILIVGLAGISAGQTPKAGNADRRSGKLTVEDRGCEEPSCLSHAHATAKDGQTLNLILMCAMRFATCQPLTPGETYIFDYVTEPTAECPKPHDAKPGTACIVIHARPYDLDYFMATIQALCGSNTTRCM